MHFRKFFRAWYEVEIRFSGNPRQKETIDGIMQAQENKVYAMSVVQVPTSYHVKQSKNGSD